jgi:hypothetical protein
LSRSAVPAGLDESEHVCGGDLGRLLGHDGEEHLQVIGRGQPRVGSGAGADEGEVIIQQRMTDPDRQQYRAISGADQARVERHGSRTSREVGGPIKEDQRAPHHRHIMGKARWD